MCIIIIITFVINIYDFRDNSRAQFQPYPLNLSTTHSFQQHNEAASTGSRKGQELSKADNLKRYLSADNDSPKSKRQKRSGTRFPRKGADVLPQI